MGLLRCWSVQNVLDLFVDGRLTESASVRVAAHLDVCENCRAEAEALKPIPAASAGTVAVPEGLADAILEKLRSEDAPAPVPASVDLRDFLRLRPAQALALVYFIALASAHALPGVPSQGLTPPDGARTEAPR
ncbi:MAG: zf-HC2 domain-containing protein [Elusimicrobiota bacterium]